MRLVLLEVSDCFSCQSSLFGGQILGFYRDSGNDVDGSRRHRTKVESVSSRCVTMKTYSGHVYGAKWSKKLTIQSFFHRR